MGYYNARDYKTFREGSYYHIYNRGNNKELTYLEAIDYEIFLNRIKIILGLTVGNKTKIKPLPQNSFSIIAYCLMPNHFHFLMRQNSNIGIDRFMLKLCTSYGKYFNKKYDRIGNIWQDTFKTKLVSNDAYLLHLIRYIIRNPQDYLNYRYSSLHELRNTDKASILDIDLLTKITGKSIQEIIDYAQVKSSYAYIHNLLLD